MSIPSQEGRNRITMLPVQSRMARAALSWGVRDLARAASVSPDTIARLERGETLYPRTVEAIRAALVAEGVEFTDGDAPGVRLKVIWRDVRTESPPADAAVVIQHQHGANTATGAHCNLAREVWMLDDGTEVPFPTAPRWTYRKQFP